MNEIVEQPNEIVQRTERNLGTKQTELWAELTREIMGRTNQREQGTAGMHQHSRLGASF